MKDSNLRVKMNKNRSIPNLKNKINNLKEVIKMNKQRLKIRKIILLQIIKVLKRKIKQSNKR